jgi:hemoglobin
MKHDIALPEDIKHLVDTFYEKVTKDDVIGYIFNDVVQVDWEKHLPKMYAFWEFLVLGMDTFKGNPIEKHFEVHQMTPLKPAHFDRWVMLFQSTVDELFEGHRADNAKFRAYAISETWKPKFVTE